MAGTHIVIVHPLILQWINRRGQEHFGLRLSVDAAVQNLQEQDLSARIGMGRQLWRYEPVDTLIGFEILLKFNIPRGSTYATIVGLGAPGVPAPRFFEIPD